MGSLICMAKFPWAAHSAAHFFHILEAVGCLLSCPLFPYMEVVGNLICMAKFPWAAHGQPTLLPTCNPWAAKWAVPLFFSVWDIGRTHDGSRQGLHRILISSQNPSYSAIFLVRHLRRPVALCVSGEKS